MHSMTTKQLKSKWIAITLIQQEKWVIFNFLQGRSITENRAFMQMLLHLNVDPVVHNPFGYLQDTANTILFFCRISLISLMMGGYLIELTLDWVPQSVNGKLNVTASLDLNLGLQLSLWPEGIQTASRFRGGTVAFWWMVMLNPSLLQHVFVDTSGLSFLLTSVENSEN